MIGGADVANRRPLVALLAQDFEVIVVGSAPVDDGYFPDVAYYHYRMGRSVSPIGDTMATNQLRKLLHRLKPDVVHAYDTKPTVFGRLAARLANVPVIVGTLPGIGSLYSDGRIQTRFVRYIYERLQQQACRVSEITVFQNDDDLAEFVSRGIVRKESVKLIRGSGVDTSIFRPDGRQEAERIALRSELAIPLGAQVVTMVSRVIRSKGVCDFAAAARILKEGTDPPAHFLLVGQFDVQSRDALSTLEWDLVQSSVHCLGRRTDVAALLAITDVFVLPSYYREGVPRALLEAAASGKALITTDYPGCREVVQHNVSGLIIPPRDPKRLAEALAELLPDAGRRERLGAAARHVAVTQFDIRIVADSLRQLYTELLSNQRVSA
jgi:glycosyltransferase involved in cell wall biosynthesis